MGNTDNIMERCALIDFDRYVEQAKSYGEWPLPDPMRGWRARGFNVHPAFSAILPYPFMTLYRYAKHRMAREYEKDESFWQEVAYLPLSTTSPHCWTMSL
ncbi:hypothetical protein [Serratia marcescens]|uniref:hypothetical protein n=1 Tax=Serratia marcescens TaxID=615 RepID=UPI003207FF28